MYLYRSTHQRPSIKKVVLKHLAKFTGKHLCQSPFFNKVAGLRPVTLLKKGLCHRCFPVNFAKLLRKHFLQNISGRRCFCLYQKTIPKNQSLEHSPKNDIIYLWARKHSSTNLINTSHIIPFIIASIPIALARRNVNFLLE